MDPRNNLLLRSLPREELERLQSKMRRVRLELDQIVYEQDDLVTDVYFPLSGALSLLILMRDGTMMEPGIIGREGMLGFPIGLGDDISRWRSVPQIAGEALVMSRADLTEHLRQPGNLNPLLTHYAGLLISLVAQSAACSQFHPLRQRCGRWLLLMHDRAGDDEFSLTHEHLGAMLGAHRPSVTLALRSLADDDLIETRRGRVRILNRAGLERDTCECYGRIQIKYEEVVEVDQGGTGHDYRPEP